MDVWWWNGPCWPHLRRFVNSTPEPYLCSLGLEFLEVFHASLQLLQINKCCLRNSGGIHKNISRKACQRKLNSVWLSQFYERWHVCNVHYNVVHVLFVTVQASFQWPMLAETQMGLSSSCVLPRLSGMIVFAFITSLYFATVYFVSRVMT